MLLSGLGHSVSICPPGRTLHAALRYPPGNYIILTLFTIVWGCFVASFTAYYEPAYVMIAITLVAAMSLGLTCIGFMLEDDLYWCFGILATIGFSVIPMIFFVIFYKKMWYATILSFTGTMLVSVYII